MLQKENRITKKKEFDDFFGKEFKQKKGKTLSSRFLILKYYLAVGKASRIGFIVNNKIDKRATKRNEIKRGLRAVVRAQLTEIKTPLDILVIAKVGSAKVEKSVIKEELLVLLRKVQNI